MKPEPKAESSRSAAKKSDASVDELFNKLQSDMRRPDLSQEAITAAFHEIQQLAIDPDVEPADPGVSSEAGRTCPSCGAANPPHNRFCATCGATLPGPPTTPAAARQPAGNPAAVHHYHHHYHHYVGAEGSSLAGVMGVPAAAPASQRDLTRLRAPAASGSTLSRAETAVRRMALDWMQACNTRQLDDLLELYLPDALVLRPNIPPVRATAAIREYFFAALDAGLGEVELEPLRVELLGDFAYEAGRCKMLVPIVVGKRREERGKYVMLYGRQPAGDWKIMLDSWSSDLSLTAAGEPAAPTTPVPAPPRPRR